MIPKTKGRTGGDRPTLKTTSALDYSPIHRLLSRLDGVRRTGPGRWIARCPTRRDRNPSLSVKELSDGRLLVYDFGGDSVDEVLSSIGLELADLYPPNPRAPGPGERHREHTPFDARDALVCLDFEASIVLLTALDLRRGRKLTDCELERLAEAVERIESAREMCHD